ncbi:enoyl-CoA hydratase/isomerase family protein [Acidisoma silvae]|uniref:3-hydroxyisobutyryl-CoA hydrolase n=1 Tax=Acidisoma silvae TaxID=2802396 RepID=A0A963YQV2_9PROT|nr:enoyl-CoA hydratase/isomerase family protein [Acidisoma silvae]MCB8875456.1 enoyl-CoA hydratase/isomerase family protein [Acidisoma silvae]
MTSTNEAAGLEAKRDGRAGRLLLRRPQALNALDLSMVRALHGQLRLWQDDPDIEIVVLEGEGRAFCAGGDVRRVRADILAGAGDAADTFFTEEYALNAAIAHFPKPYVSLIQGACMGGGLGISIHGSDRVLTETALLAMPETAIGFAPDIGASYFLPRLPGALGFYLGLTGTRLAGADAVHAGLGTAFVPSDRLTELGDALAKDGRGAISQFAVALPLYSLAPLLPAIDACFSAESVPAILARLAAMDSDWARAALAELNRHSPSALCWSLTALKAGARLDLDSALAAELRLAQRLIRLPDFAEGVRAMLVDKDRKPRWQPARLEDVDPRLIRDLFRP